MANVPFVVGQAAGGMAGVWPRLMNMKRQHDMIEDAQSYVRGNATDIDGRSVRQKLSEPTSSRMAGRMRTRRSFRGRRRFRRRRLRRPPSVMIPYSIVRKLKSVVQTSYDPAAATTTPFTVKLSSAYDPMGALGAGQPLGFDQYSALYNRYAVLGWKVKIEYVTKDSTNAGVIGFCPIVSSTTLTQYEHYKELPANVSAIFSPDNDRGVFFAKGGVKRWLLPRGGKMLSDDTVTASTSADPTRMLHGHLYVAPIDNTADVGVTTVVVTLTQIVCFFVPVVPSRS